MKDCLILGTGRSGTSMLAGCLARAGYHQGEGLHLPRSANPKGFFEAPEINGLNEELLALSLRGTPAGERFREGQRWLAAAPPWRATVPPGLLQRMTAALGRRPFAYKDPRFCFTLPAWRPLLGETRFLVVFRDPRSTVASMLEECRRAPYLAGLDPTEAELTDLWVAAHRRLLAEAGRGSWRFVHAEQILDGSALPDLERFLEASLDARFPEQTLLRESPAGPLEGPLGELYAELCARAGHRPGARSSGPRPRLAGLCRVRSESEARRAIAAAERCRGVELELFLAVPPGGRFEGLEAPAGLALRWLEVPGDSEGRAVQLAAQATQAPFLALFDPDVEPLPGRLSAAAQALASSDAELWSSDFFLSDAHGQFVGRSSADLMGEAPGPRFEASLVGRREAWLSTPTADFFPAIRARWAAARRAGRWLHARQPGQVIARDLYQREYEDSRRTAASVAQWSRPAPALARPRLTVSLCTYDRRDVLEECLRALCRQTVPPGTFELVLVDDGSKDGTAEFLQGLELPLPHRLVRQPNGGLASARNTGLALARGEFVLFINDDTIADPGLVEAHLAAHQSLGRPACVLGNLRQPPGALENALMRVIEAGDFMFDYARLSPGQVLDGLHFYTCNVSAPLAAVRAAGGFDQSFRHYGCEDSDLGLALEAAGLELHYRPECSAEHRHLFDLEYVRRRARTVGQASIRLMRKHPALVERWNNRGLGLEFLREELSRKAGKQGQLERLAATLSSVDLGALAPLSDGARAFGKAVETRLENALVELHRLWFWQGNRDGLEQARLEGVAEFERAMPLAGARLAGPRTLLAAPDWSDLQALDRIIGAAEALAGFARWKLLLPAWTGHLPELQRELEQQLAAAYARREAARGAGAPAFDLEVDLEPWPESSGAWLELEAQADAWFGPGPDPALMPLELRLERFEEAPQLLGWRRRFGVDLPVPLGLERPAPPGSPWAQRALGSGSEPELSVVIASQDRPKLLLALLERLAAQDLSPRRFEVLLVDDGSAEPLETALTGRPWPFPLLLLRQPASGPAAARNRALERARGDFVLFLNDDAVPGPDLLSRHLALQRGSSEPAAILGRFDLLPEHRQDSFGDHLHSSTALFAQPRMQPGVHYHGLALCTGNLSVPRAVLAEVGGFDAGFPAPGGEDSELGLRLERQRGVRVRYEPGLECGHDHALGIRDLARRKKVLGAAVARIQNLHGDVGLTPGLGWPLAPAALGELERETVVFAPRLEAVQAQIERLCAEERRTGRRSPDRAALASLIRFVEERCFRQGLWEALTGGSPAEPAPGSDRSGNARAIEAQPALRPDGPRSRSASGSSAGAASESAAGGRGARARNGPAEVSDAQATEATAPAAGSRSAPSPSPLASSEQPASAPRARPGPGGLKLSLG
jgi:glycosyltransferase involved in cell wall biosynthesis